MSTQLSVNLNAVAVLRNRRNLPWPSVEHLGQLALTAGAHGLTVHPRPDQRHIRFADLAVLRRLTAEFAPKAEFNIEGYPTKEFIELVIAHRPDQVTLVPDDPNQSTSDHGWDFIQHQQFLTHVVGKLHENSLRVSLFCNPDAEAKQIAAASATGANRIELYTGPYGAAYDDPQAAQVELQKLAATAISARSLGMAINAGHDLTVENLPPLVTAIPFLAEVSIGQALIADALEFGLAETVRRFRNACNDAGDL